MKEIIAKLKKNANGTYRLEFQDFPETPDSDRVLLHIIKENGERRSYSIFRQAARSYERWNDYVEYHGCAVCSLATILSGSINGTYSAEGSLTPVDAIHLERQIFGEKIWRGNYGKPMKKQMPISMYGISKILTSQNISNQYISDFHAKKALREIRTHLYKGKPVIVEARRIKMWGKIPVSLSKKYAGSYHTMVLFGFDKEGNVIFSDSAHRDWAGREQRIKRSKLEDIVSYMYGKKNPNQFSLYFKERKYSGGYILVDL